MVDFTYRLWLLNQLGQVFLVPGAFIFIVSRAISQRAPHLSFSTTANAILYLFGPPLFWFARLHVSRWRDEMKARRRGVQLAPLISGKQIGNVDLLKRFMDGVRYDYVGKVVDELLDEVGVDTARMSLLWSADKVITRDHDVVKYIYSTGFNNFAKGDQANRRAFSFWGYGIFGADGDRWKFHRNLARPYFSKDRIHDYDAFSKYTAKTLAVVKEAALRDEAIDVQDLFARFTLDTAGEFLFGTSDLNTLDEPLPQAGKAQMGPKGSAIEGAFGTFASAFEGAQLHVITRSASPDVFWTTKEFFGDGLASHKRVMDDYLYPLARQALYEKKARSEGKEKTQEVSFLEHLAGSTDDIQVVRDQLLNMLLAARDTTAALLSFACYLLAKHPEVMERLRSEIQSTIGSTTPPTYDDLKGFKYLRAVLNETLRLFPPVPLNARAPQRDCVVPTRNGPIFAPANGVSWLMSIISIHKRKDLWGPDADVFDPDRWMDERAKGVVSDPFKFLPFHAGPRTCLGQQFAYNEASFVIVRLLQSFESFTVAQAEAAPAGSLPPASWKSMEDRRGVEDCIPQSAMTLYAKGGLWLRMHAA